MLAHKSASGAAKTLSWTAVAGAASYQVWWRDTVEPSWTHSRDAGAPTILTLKGSNIDDDDFGVSAVAADGSQSPVEFPGLVGAFAAPAKATP